MSNDTQSDEAVMAGAVPADEQPAVQEVTFYSVRTGAPYTTADPAEITRLDMGRTHSREQVTEPEDAAQFDPADHTVEEVVNYLAENPSEIDRVREQEREGKNRKSITGDA